MSRIDDPASAVAASHCLVAWTVSDLGVTRLHPGPCGWCVWPLSVLSGMVEAFNAVAGYDPSRGRYDPSRHDVRVFQSLPRTEQAALVAEAQGLEDPA